MKKDFECPAFDMSCPYFDFETGLCELGEDAKDECDEAWIDEEDEE